MSLLIKALEQAAKDRDGTKAVPTPLPPSTALSTEPTLEASTPSRATRAPDPGASTTSAAASDRSSSPLSLDEPSSPRRAAPAAALAQIDAQQQRARAAAVMQASENTGRGFLGSLRGNPV